MNDIDDELLYRYFSDEAAPEEVAKIERWLREDAGHQREFDAAHLIFNAMTLQQERLRAEADRRMSRLLLRRRIVRTCIRAAAAVALIVGAGYAGGLVGKESLYRDMAVRMQAVEVPAGQRMSMTLADGTSVCLNGGSRIEYQLVFAKDRRRVRLTGEALFEVTHDARHPFVVETFASEVEVLGTTFDVYADDERGRFTTTLVEGKVRVTNLLDGDREQVVLHSSESVSLVGNRLVRGTRADQDALCWTEGFISIGRVGFDELMARFENAYSVTIVLDRPTLPSIGFASGKIRISEGIDFALKMLQQACDFTYTKDTETNTITIR